MKRTFTVEDACAIAQMLSNLDRETNKEQEERENAVSAEIRKQVFDWQLKKS